MQQLSGSVGRPSPCSPRAKPRIRADGPARGAEKRILFSGLSVGFEVTLEEGGTEAEAEGLLAFGALAGFTVAFEGFGAGSASKRE